MQIVNGILLILSSLFFLIFLTASIHEKERRAALLAAAGLVVNSCVWLLFVRFGDLKWVAHLNLAALIAVGVFVLVSAFKYFPHAEQRDLSEAEKYDERDIMFARNRLQYHPHLAEKYYNAHPENRETDKKIHSKPELGEPGSTYYDSLRSPIFDAAFAYLHRTRGASKGEAAQEKKETDPHEITGIIREMGRYFGAIDVGITPVKPYHIYSHAGRQAENWGEEIDNTHPFAVVIVVPMRVDMMKSAPGLPAILESSRLYVESAKIAHIVAEYIRSLGYDARSHTDGNYETLCVPLAVDAGLGALGRMGIFMHPVHGPCVRISTVTTNMELVPTKPHTHIRSIEKFCDICKKCSDNCPTQSICGENEPVSRGFRHWSIDQEKCFSFWKNIGTDCGFCIRVCPYTKPDTLIHKMVRFYISRNPINQRTALFLDDLFYGRKISIFKT
jgi:reductive dehalogenase